MHAYIKRDKSLLSNIHKLRNIYICILSTKKCNYTTIEALPITANSHIFAHGTPKRMFTDLTKSNIPFTRSAPATYARTHSSKPMWGSLLALVGQVGK